MSALRCRKRKKYIQYVTYCILSNHTNISAIFNFMKITCSFYIISDHLISIGGDISMVEIDELSQIKKFETFWVNPLNPQKKLNSINPFHVA